MNNLMRKIMGRSWIGDFKDWYLLCLSIGTLALFMWFLSLVARPA